MHDPAVFQPPDGDFHIPPCGVLSEDRTDNDFKRSFTRPPVQVAEVVIQLSID